MLAVVRAAFATVLLFAFASRAEQELPVYPGAIHTRIGNDLVISGEYYRLAYFLTDDSIPQVAQYFIKEWKRRGIPTMLDGDGRDEVIVSAFYTREGLQRAVILRKHQGRTLGFTVLKDLWVQMDAPDREEPPIENALFASEIADRDERISGQYVTALVDASLDDATAQTEARLAKEGFSRTGLRKQKLKGKSNWVLEFERGAQQVVTTLVEVDSKLTVVNESRTLKLKEKSP